MQWYLKIGLAFLGNLFYTKTCLFALTKEKNFLQRISNIQPTQYLDGNYNL